MDRFISGFSPDSQFTGISLDLDRGGSAIRFTGSTVHNPAVGSDTRWLPSLIRDGTVTDAKVSRIEGGALAPLTGFGTGIGPSTSVSDALYEAGGGFLFATIDFEVPAPASTSTVSLSVGHNLLSDINGLASGDIFFGVSDGPVTNTVGSTGGVDDLILMPQTLQPSDFDSDGDVDGDDLLTWQKGFGIMSGASRSQGDANSDGKVDSADLALWQSQYSTLQAGPVGGVAVPEASTFCLALCGATVCSSIFSQRRAFLR